MKPWDTRQALSTTGPDGTTARRLPALRDARLDNQASELVSVNNPTAGAAHDHAII